MSTQPSGAIEHVVVDGLARLPEFCHASIAGEWIHVSGTLGTEPDSMTLARGGTGPETRRTLLNIELILEACDATLADVVKVSVFLRDLDTFGAMNRAYAEIMGANPPARITVGRADLALDASVEIECVAYRSRN